MLNKIIKSKWQNKGIETSFGAFGLILKCGQFIRKRR